MITLLIAIGATAAPLQADPAAAIADPANRAAANLCESALAREANGTIGSIRVESAQRSGARTTLSGDLEVFEKAAPPSPGELAPHHVIAAHFAFRCSLCGQKVVNATVVPEPN